MKRILVLSLILLMNAPVVQAESIEDTPLSQLVNLEDLQNRGWNSTVDSPSYTRKTTNKKVVEMNGKHYKILEYDNGQTAIKEGQYWHR